MTNSKQKKTPPATAASNTKQRELKDTKAAKAALQDNPAEVPSSTAKSSAASSKTVKAKSAATKSAATKSTTTKSAETKSTAAKTDSVKTTTKSADAKTTSAKVAAKTNAKVATKTKADSAVAEHKASVNVAKNTKTKAEKTADKSSAKTSEKSTAKVANKTTAKAASKSTANKADTEAKDTKSAKADKTVKSAKAVKKAKADKSVKSNKANKDAKLSQETGEYNPELKHVAQFASRLYSHGAVETLSEGMELARKMVLEGEDIESILADYDNLNRANLSVGEQENCDALAATLEAAAMQASESNNESSKEQQSDEDVDVAVKAAADAESHSAALKDHDDADHNNANADKENNYVKYPLVTLRSIIITPAANVQLIAAREITVTALQLALDSKGRDVAVFTQNDDSSVRPEKEKLHRVGVLAKVINSNLQNEQFRATIRGYQRISIRRIIDDPSSVVRFVEVEELKEPELDPVAAQRYIEALRSSLDYALKLQNQKGRIVLDKNIPQELIRAIRGVDNLSALTDGLGQVLLLPYIDKKYVLESLNPIDRARALIAFLNNFSYKAEVDKKISEDAREAMDRNQRDYYLNEQLKAIKRELNILADDGNDIEDYKSKLASFDAPIETINRLQKEISRLSAMPINSGENATVRNYIDVLFSLPWRKSSPLNKDLNKAKELLEKEHYGLRKVKDRILEFLAVQTRRDNKETHGQILCLMGPPGIGKTSLGASIAKATGRKYVRVALGGMYDESEIRGHRRTYIGAMPGRIIQSLIKVDVNNPLFLLDEIDKISTSSYHGDIAAALLEVLDPEQNKAFADNYVDLDFDLSKVLFIATANSYNIPPALRDRMEIIDLSSYTADEKFHIAREHLLPKQLKANELEPEEFDITDAGLKHLITYYTLESGVRNLERIIGELCRKTVKDLMLNPPKQPKKRVVGVKDIEKMIGPKRFDFTFKLAENRVGIVNGLSVSSVGGDMLQVEVIANEGKGSHLLTGQLGSVMKESVSAAISWVRSHARSLSLAPDFYQSVDLHVHFPEGAIKKDGPSAGIATVTAIVSALTGNPVRADVAMTGEITLRGDVLAIGGLKEKLLAALRGGVKTVCIPMENKKDLWDIPKNVTEGLKIIPVKVIDEVLDIALEHKPAKFKPNANSEWTLESYEERQKKRRLRDEAEEQKYIHEISDNRGMKITEINNDEESNADEPKPKPERKPDPSSDPVQEPDPDSKSTKLPLETE